MASISQTISVHKEIYEKFDGLETIPVFLDALGWLENIHKHYSGPNGNDILLLDIGQYMKLMSNRQYRNPRNAFWTRDNPFPINSTPDAAEVLSFMATIYDCPQHNWIRPQNIERINWILTEVLPNIDYIVVMCRYKKLTGLWVAHLPRDHKLKNEITL